MALFTRLQTLDRDIIPSRCKLHLATRDGVSDPLDAYRKGVFDEWQSDQKRRNFSKRDFIVALIGMPEPNLWLFAGVHEVLGEEQREGRVRYQTERRVACEDLDGHLVVAFTRPGRQSYLDAEKYAAQLTVHAFHAKKLG